jgi:hypothetical protein
MNVGIAFSGGGFRATLFHLGVIRYLHREGRLGDVTHICSVSGGSVLAAHLVQNWERYTGTAEDFESAADELVRFVQSDVRGRIVRRFLTVWPTLLLPEGGRFDRFRVSATRLPQRFYHRELFEQLRDSGRTKDRMQSREGILGELDSDLHSKPYLEILATNLNYGTVAAFNAEGYYFETAPIETDGATGPGNAADYPSSTTPIALAVASSSAYPALFAPVRLTKESLGETSGALPDQTHLLTDGGVFDNLGVSRFRSILQKEGSFPLVRGQDILEPARIASALIEGAMEDGPRPFARLWRLLTPTAHREVERSRQKENGCSAALVAPLNYLIRRTDLYDPDGWHEVALSGEARNRLLKGHDPLDRYALFMKNRLLIESAFPGAVAACSEQPILVLVSDAGRSFQRITEIRFSDFFLSTAVRASDVLMNRIAQMERAKSRDDGKFLFISINDTVDDHAEPFAPDRSIQRAVAQIRTDFDRFSDAEVSGLVRHGYCVARKAYAGLLEEPSEHQHEPPWDPVRSRPPGHDYTQTDASDRNALERSKYRRLGLFSLRDWISYIHLVFLVALAFAGWLLWHEAASVVSELVLRARTGTAYAHYKAPTIDFWEVLDPYHIDETRYKEVDNLPEPNHGGFRIQSDDRLFDLQHWRPVTDRALAAFKGRDEGFPSWVREWRSRTSDERIGLLRRLGEPMILTRHIRFSKKAANDMPLGARNDEIHFQFLTHGFGVVPRLSPEDQKHTQWSVLRSRRLGSAGSQDAKKWDLVVKLPDEKPGDSMTLKVEAIFWNGYQSEEDLTAMIKINEPTSEASLWVLFPEGKPYDTYVLHQYFIDHRTAGPIEKAGPLTNTRRTKLFWQLDGTAEPHQIFEIKWSW